MHNSFDHEEEQFVTAECPECHHMFDQKVKIEVTHGTPNISLEAK